ncbi:hypothetical protein NQ015_04370 [Corynebacterium sp. 153RC1]|uniref:hypothetical protein n=1 Tax=Corynebacterium TaxID=1716 RepID=UPI00211CC2F0|nr:MULTISPECIES: hypothetical protein [unclassified Corynebacterium]MCQ9364649.1 hypothetical protein [Corynebacterium sp. 70RC1]MCQ9371552.1 hypothetical protein [Corynebacterium sp. 35RC1]MCQ9343091.1 hypothetical protein [Corynebacterium sp. 76QC2CO]MCQ9352106.1 hypothetical protein [Corynebacterium sp. 209RC1]MCQ9354108.1 hypothetical protein [Corynebacterium sp. 1222RC1]
MNRKGLWGSFAAIVLFSFVGLLLSGILWEPRSATIIIAAFFGTLIIATIIWVPLYYFMKKYQSRKETD